MKPITDQIRNEMVRRFRFEGQFIGTAPYGEGHINDTFAVGFRREGRTRRYILQRINTNVFRDPGSLMENVAGVTEFLRRKIKATGGDPERETLNLVPAKDGASFARDADGGCWRAYRFIEGTLTLQQPRNADDFYESARALGKFQLLLADYPAGTLHETIPRFHDTPNRMRQFRRALQDDILRRADGAREEIGFALEREAYAGLLTGLLKQKKLPLRVTHNDTKLNNILLDKATGKGLCLIDLDTVMPGLSLYDFGDSIRFGASTAAEDEPDLSKVHFDPGLFEAFTKGYLETAGSVLTQEEIDLLPDGAKTMTLECGIRFLTDYLSGDVYFKTERERQNLDRCRTQFRLIAEMEEQWDDMKRIVGRYR